MWVPPENVAALGSDVTAFYLGNSVGPVLNLGICHIGKSGDLHHLRVDLAR